MRLRVTRDLLIVFTMFILLTVLNITTIISSQNAQNAAERAAQALDQNDINRNYLDELMRSTGICTLRSSGAVNTQEIPYTTEAIVDYYNKCLVERAGPAPSE